ncbi:MAG: nicotinamide mononucleotide transporter [Bacteroidales bacterium]|jgi:nicotinamide mononucleotide transporter|nr:nicotinamide mononucleotide transporter [Bacteroidales bacterium]
MSVDLVIEIIGAIIGLIYIFLEYKANVWLWPVGILMSLFYLVIFLHGKFYADAAIYLYYIGANIYGLIAWGHSRRNPQSSMEKPAENLVITHTPKRLVLPLTIIAVILWIAIFWILKTFTDSPVPVGDAFTTALSIVAMWMLAQKYLEQWVLWIVVNIVSTILYFWKGLYPTGVLFIVYVIIAVLGYFRWRKEIA